MLLPSRCNPGNASAVSQKFLAPGLLSTEAAPGEFRAEDFAIQSVDHRSFDVAGSDVHELLLTSGRGGGTPPSSCASVTELLNGCCECPYSSDIDRHHGTQRFRARRKMSQALCLVRLAFEQQELFHQFD